jgi:TM2 domain-containing membrane protein YozV
MPRTQTAPVQSSSPSWAAINPVSGYQPVFAGIRSDRSRAAAGILQLILPGVGRMYLGYLAYGVLQLLLTIMTCGLLWLWSFIDGIIILTGGVKLDGYGRQLPD